MDGGLFGLLHGILFLGFVVLQVVMSVGILLSFGKNFLLIPKFKIYIIDYEK